MWSLHAALCNKAAMGCIPGDFGIFSHPARSNYLSKALSDELVKTIYASDIEQSLSK